MTIARALTIAGSDSGGGAGIQADLKTFQELQVYGMSAITAVTAQNTLGVHGVYPLPIPAVVSQIEAVATDIGVDAVKTGMLFQAEMIEAIAEQMKRHRWTKIVVDPVMIAKGGAALLREDAVDSLKEQLIPLAWIITPNIPEAEALTGITIRSLEDRRVACQRLYDLGARHVLIKGGHSEDSQEVVDVLYDGQQYMQWTRQRIATRHTHGTGCTFAAAITAELAKGAAIVDAVTIAKSFIHAAISHPLDIGQGHGPTNHWAYQRGGRHA